jgi:putative DNA primase/helicase
MRTDFLHALRRYLPSGLLPRVESPPHGQRTNAVLPSFKPIGLQAFLALDVPPREMLLAPILPERSLGMLYAPRGIGKSWLGLSMALTVASGGSLLRWNAPRPRRVLYVDGEMPLPDLQARLDLIIAGAGIEIENWGMKILAADDTEHGINLASTEGQRALEENLDGVDLLVLDNLSTLTTGSEGASDAWLPTQNWLLRLRRRGVAVLLVHHAGVNGRQRGTSRREDALDTVIALRRPNNYSPEQGARFEVHLEKARTLAGGAAMPFEAAIEPFADADSKPGVRWKASDIQSAVPALDRAAALYEAGLTVRQAAGMLGISRSEAGRLRLRAIAEGLYEPEGQDDADLEELGPEGVCRPN